MILDYIPILLVLGVALVFGIVVVWSSTLIGPQRPNSQKTSTYESGMQPYGEAIRRIPVKFYRVAVLFILFDIEVIFFLPWAVIFRDLRLYGLAVMGVFFFILTVGFVYEWKVGGLEWE